MDVLEQIGVAMDVLIQPLAAGVRICSMNGIMDMFNSQKFVFPVFLRHQS